MPSEEELWNRLMGVCLGRLSNLNGTPDFLKSFLVVSVGTGIITRSFFFCFISKIE